MFKWKEEVIERDLKLKMVNTAAPLQRVFAEEWDGRSPLADDTFHIGNWEKILKNYPHLFFLEGYSYKDFFKSPRYIGLYGLRGHKQHNILRLKIDQIDHTKVLTINAQRIVKPIPFRYTFETVKEQSFVAWQALSVEKQHISGKDWYCEWEPSRGQGILMSIPADVIAELYQREVRKAEEVMRTIGFRNSTVYATHAWFSALYSYQNHSRYSAQIRSMIKGDYLVICDAIGVLGLTCTDLNPSPYAIGSVQLESASSVIQRWKQETLIICFGSTFLTQQDRNIINMSKSPLIVLDVTSIMFEGVRDFGSGLTARGIAKIPFQRNLEMAPFTDPVFTHNLLTKCESPKKLYYIVSDGNALRYIERMTPGVAVACLPELEQFLQSHGLIAHQALYDRKIHFRVIENFENWRKYRSGYFVPAGIEDPPIVTIRRPMRIYQTRVIYHITTFSMERAVSELGITTSFSSNGSSAHFIFPRELQTEHFKAVDEPQYGMKNVFAYQYYDEIVVYSAAGPGVGVRTSNKDVFKMDLKEISGIYGKSDYQKIKAALLTSDNATIRFWVDEYG